MRPDFNLVRAPAAAVGRDKCKRLPREDTAEEDTKTNAAAPSHLAPRSRPLSVSPLSLTSLLEGCEEERARARPAWAAYCEGSGTTAHLAEHTIFSFGLQWGTCADAQERNLRALQTSAIAHPPT